MVVGVNSGLVLGLMQSTLIHAKPIGMVWIGMIKLRGGLGFGIILVTRSEEIRVILLSLVSSNVVIRAWGFSHGIRFVVITPSYLRGEIWI